MGSSCPLFRPSFSTCLLVQTSLWYDLFKDVPRTSTHWWAPLWALDSPVAGGKTLCLGSILSPSDPSGTGQTQSPASPTAPTPGLLFSSPSLCSKPHCGREPASCSLRGGQHLGSCSTSEGLQAVRKSCTRPHSPPPPLQAPGHRASLLLPRPRLPALSRGAASQETLPLTPAGPPKGAFPTWDLDFSLLRLAVAVGVSRPPAQTWPLKPGAGWELGRPSRTWSLKPGSRLSFFFLHSPWHLAHHFARNRHLVHQLEECKPLSRKAPCLLAFLYPSQHLAACFIWQMCLISIFDWFTGKKVIQTCLLETSNKPLYSIFCSQLSWNGPFGINPEGAVNKDGCIILLSPILHPSRLPRLHPQLCLIASKFTPVQLLNCANSPWIFILNNNVCFQSNWIQRGLKGCRTLYNTCCERRGNPEFAPWHLIQETQFIRAVFIYLCFSDAVLGENSLRHKIRRALLAKPGSLIQMLNIFRRVKCSRPSMFCPLSETS